jgi:hypothetical protein
MGINREMNRNKERFSQKRSSEQHESKLNILTESPMRQTCELYRLEGTTYGNYVMGIISFNSRYFTDGIALISEYSQFIMDFVAFENKQKRLFRIIEFLEDSVENSHLNDYISYIDFKIKDDHIIFKQNGEVQDWINMGEIISDDYQINCCGSYMFFTDLISNKQFMYYGD